MIARPRSDGDGGQRSLDFAAATTRRDAGMASSAAHAERVHAEWCADAMAALLRFARTREHFLAEEYVADALARGLTEPPDRRAFGSILQRAARAHVIAHDGFAAAATSNGSAKVRWRTQFNQAPASAGKETA
jgi:hypothetical protein